MQSDDFFLKIRSCSCRLEWKTTISVEKVKRCPGKKTTISENANFVATCKYWIDI